MKHSALFSLFMLCASVSGQAFATLLTLDGNDIRNQGQFVEGEYQIFADTGLVNGGNLAIRDNLEALGFANAFMETWNTTAIFTLSRIDSGLFNFDGLDVGGYFAGQAAWTFSGFRGAQQIYSAVDTRFAGFLAFDWVGVDSITIQSSQGSAASSFDNIQVSAFTVAPQVAAFTTVSEPPLQAAILVLFGVIATRKRKQRI